MKFLLFLGLLLYSCLSGLSDSIITGEPLQITIKGVPVEEQSRVTGTYVVSDGGTVSLPMISTPVTARGLSPASLGRRIEAAYKQAGIYTTPSISVISQKAIDEKTADIERSLTVSGQVTKSGPVPYRKGMTLFEAVQLAGGETPFGSLRRVKVLRKGAQREYDLRENRNKLVKVYPRDIIEVPQKNWLGQ